MDESTKQTSQRRREEMAEEREVVQDGERLRRDDDWSSMRISIMVMGIVVVVALILGFVSYERSSDVRTELAAKANSDDVAREITRLDSANARQDSVITETRSNVGVLTSVATTLNTRVVKAEENLDKNRRAAAAAASSAKKANRLVQEARDQLVRLDAESKAWRDSTAGAIVGIPREIDSRVGPVAADLSTFQRVQAAAHVAQDSVSAVHTAAIRAFQAKLRLSDRDVSRLAAELEKRQQRKKGR